MFELNPRPVLNKREMSSYREFGEKTFNRIIKTSDQIGKKTVVHINATPEGGGVAELLKSQVPLEKSIGLDSFWFSFNAPDDFFSVSKKIHNLFQGKPGKLTKKELASYLKICGGIGESLMEFLRKFPPGIIVFHDPQPLPLINFIPDSWKTVLRLHLDVSAPNTLALNFFKPYIDHFSCIIVSTPQYAVSLGKWFKKENIKVIPPAIDPLSLKNLPMEISEARKVLEEYGLDFSRPIVSQVSRFDPWKDPLGVIQAYYLAKKEAPDIQLALAGFFFAQDDPESEFIFKEVKAEAGDDPDIFLFSNPGVLKGTSNDEFISALYLASDVVLQKSIKEGFGLTITEAMWKKKAVIAGNTDGTSLQIKNGQNGILVQSPEEAAKAIIRLLKNESLREKLGKAAQESVRENFLLPRYLLDNLELYLSLLNG